MKLHHSKLMPFHGERALEYFDFELYAPSTDLDEPTQFWLYSYEDYRALCAHRGRAYVFWHGIDVLFLLQNKERLLRGFRGANPVCACHNELQQKYLAEMGIYACVRPWFINDVTKYAPGAKKSKKVHVSSHIDRELEYGEAMVNAVAFAMPDWEFHIFGSEQTMPVNENVFYHGQVPEDDMDAMTEDHAGTIRWKHYDGVSQTVMKALFRGQLAITAINYPFTCYARGVEDIIFYLRHGSPTPLARLEANDFSWMA